MNINVKAVKCSTFDRGCKKWQAVLWILKFKWNCISSSVWVCIDKNKINDIFTTVAQKCLFNFKAGIVFSSQCYLKKTTTWLWKIPCVWLNIKNRMNNNSTSIKITILITYIQDIMIETLGGPIDIQWGVSYA